MLFKIGVLIYGYFAGALIQAGYWMGKFNKIDIRDYGSGNAGTTNVMRTPVSYTHLDVYKRQYYGFSKCYYRHV